MTSNGGHEPTRVDFVTARQRTAVIALCRGTAVIAFGLGYLGGDMKPWDNQTTSSAVSASSHVVTISPAPAPQPIPGTRGGGITVRPAGGGGCIIGLNCGCTQRSGSCNGRHVRPGNGVNRNVPPPPAPPPDGDPGASPPP